MSTPKPAKYLQEDEIITQECKNLISTLPIEQGWILNHMYQYQGFWYTSRLLQGLLACHRHFQAQDSDILLVTVPKSGTTWLKALCFALVNRVRYPNPQHNHPLLTQNPHALVPFLEAKLYLEPQLPDLSTSPSPRLFSTHLPVVLLPESVNESSCKIVYLCRNPKDTFVSLWHFTNKLRAKDRGASSLEEAFDLFCKGVSLYGPFWDHVLGYWKESLEKPHKVLFLKYEEVKEQPAVHVRKLAKFLECPFSPEEEADGVVDDILKICSFDHLSNLEVNKSGKLAFGEENKAFFRTGTVGDWVNHLTIEMAQQIDAITEQKLLGSGLDF